MEDLNLKILIIIKLEHYNQRVKVIVFTYDYKVLVEHYQKFS